MKTKSNGFQVWRESMGLTQEYAAFVLACNVRTVQRYETADPDYLDHSVPPVAVLKLMWAIANGIPLTQWPWEPTHTLEMDPELIACTSAWWSSINGRFVGNDYDLSPTIWRGPVSMERPLHSSWFRTWRWGTGITQGQAAELFGTSVRTIQRYDDVSSPKNTPMLKVMWGVAHGIPLDEWPMDPGVSTKMAWEASNRVWNQPSWDDEPPTENAKAAQGRGDRDELSATNCRGPRVDDKPPPIVGRVARGFWRALHLWK
jgi:hypothetical protein